MHYLVTGGKGFVGGYLIQDLLEAGHKVTAIDNFSKYGEVSHQFDSNENFRFIQGDCRDVQLLTALMEDVDIVVAAAALIGGITYFHEFAYDLLSQNEQILAATFDAAIQAYKTKQLQRIVVISSSMVFESTNIFPTPEGAELVSPPPKSSYGFQKLSSEYFARAAYSQYGLPFTIVRPFNCIGVGEKKVLQGQKTLSGNIELTMSHVVPDLIKKILLGQHPVRILGSGQQIRCYTYGGDLARGIRLASESSQGINEDFNISVSTPTTVIDLARTIFEQIHEDRKDFEWVSDTPFKYDVEKRIPDTTKARERLGFEATTPLSAALQEIIPWVKEMLNKGQI